MSDSSNNAPHSAAPQKPKATSRPADKPYDGKNYEENPLNEKDLLNAVDSVPVKDYTDYEIEVESKAHYEDALFDTGDDLDKALELVRQEKAQEEQQREERKLSDTQETAAVSTAPKKREKTYDFSPFLATAIPEGIELIKAPIATPASGVNNSPLDTSQDFSAAPQPGQPLIEDVSDIEEAAAATEEPAAEPKTLAEKLKFKAKQQLSKSKAHFDEYIGRSLPERELPLDFTFPLQKSKKDLDNTVSGYSIRKLFETKGKSALSLFKQADSDLATVCKSQMLGSSRHNLLDAYCEPLIEKLQEVISSVERKPNLTGDSKRLAVAEHSQNALKSLILGYKQVYSSYYEAANVVYGPQRNSANAVAFRLFNLLLLEAQLCFALHAQVPSSSVKAINKLFVALRLYEPHQICQRQTSLLNGEDTSIKTLHFHYQVLITLHSFNITSLLYRVVNPYLADKVALLSLIEIDVTSDSQALWVIPHDHKQTPTLGSTNTPAIDFPATVIDVAPLFYAIKRDYKLCVEHLGENTWKPDNKFLAAIKPHYRIAMLSGLNQLIQTHEQATITPNYSIFQPARFRSFSGLDNILNYLQFTYAVATRQPKKTGEPAQEMPEKPRADKASWQVAREEEDKLYLQLSEAESAAQVDIGQLVLLIEIPAANSESTAESVDDDSQEETQILGLVEQAHRPQPNKLNLIIRKLSYEFTHASLDDSDSKAGQTTLFALGSNGPMLMTDYLLDATQPEHSLTLPDGSQRDIHIEAALYITAKTQILLAG